MEVTVALEARFMVTPEGSVWSQAGMTIWERYLEVFDAVRIVARAARVEQAPDGWLRVDGKNILLHGLPDYRGPWQCFKQYPAIRAAVGSATPQRGAVILRVGSQVANMLEHPLQRQNHPYALEVISDPFDSLAPKAVESPLRPFFRWHFSRRLRRQCLHAKAVAYVTKRALQDRYPARLMNVGISDVELPPEAFLDYAAQAHDPKVESRKPKRQGPYQLVTVGTLAQPYKGTDVLIEAVARCVRVGLDLTAVIVGDGKYRRELMAEAERAGVSSRIQFRGQVAAGEAVRNILDAADLFVLPSRQEGLPRALVEAMARGLPCIGATVGGIPELLDPSELVPVNDPAALAVKIQEVLRDALRMEAMSRRNLAVAREYCDSALAPRRRAFYRYVRDLTASWESSQRV
jgi:glycosyltransferase involved in cell wall biosynthesis